MPNRNHMFCKSAAVGHLENLTFFLHTSPIEIGLTNTKPTLAKCRYYAFMLSLPAILPTSSLTDYFFSLLSMATTLATTLWAYYLTNSTRPDYVLDFYTTTKITILQWFKCSLRLFYLQRVKASPWKRFYRSLSNKSIELLHYERR